MIVMTKRKDEMRRKWRPRKALCLECKRVFKLKRRGRAPSYCSGKCRNQAYWKRKSQGPREVVARTIQGIYDRAFVLGVAEEVVKILQQWGVIPAPEPPQLKPKPKAASPLRLVGEDSGDNH